MKQASCSLTTDVDITAVKSPKGKRYIHMRRKYECDENVLHVSYNSAVLYFGSLFSKWN